MMILLTGASGLLGGHILKEGLKAGYKFRAVSRSIPKRSYLEKCLSQIEYHQVDLAYDEISDKTLENIDVIIHCAALASSSKEDTSLMRSLNIKVGQKLFNKASRFQIKHWVQISSISTMDYGFATSAITEEDHGKTRSTPYSQSKFELDQWLEQQESIPISTIHPCYMLGAFDARPSSGAILFAIKFGKIKHLYESQKNFVASSDVARAIINCIERKKFDRYIIGGHNIYLKDFVTKICNRLNIENRVSFHQQNVDLSQIEITQREFMKEFSMSSAISYSKARRELNYSPELNLDQMVEETVTFFIENKVLRVKKASS